MECGMKVGLRKKLAAVLRKKHGIDREESLEYAELVLIQLRHGLYPRMLAVLWNDLEEFRSVKRDGYCGERRP